MTVFKWTAKPSDPDTNDNDEFNTYWFIPTASCLMCGEPIQHGQRVMAWRADTDLVFHGDCVKSRVAGLLKDIAECMK